MFKYHTNPETGQTGQCIARIECRFKLSNEEHYTTREEAVKGYEIKMQEETLPKPLKRNNMLTSPDNLIARLKINNKESFEKEQRNEDISNPSLINISDLNRIKLQETKQSIIEHGDPKLWMKEKFQELNDKDPMVLSHHHDLNIIAGSKDSSTQEIKTINPQRIIQAFGSDGFGLANNRRYSYDDIAKGLMNSSVETWVSKMNVKNSEPHVVEINGSHGPIYKIGRDGRHRSDVLKATGVSEWKYSVTKTSNAKAGDKVIIKDLSHHRLLTKCGIINNESKLNKDIDFAWELETPEKVEAVSQAYARQYPNFGSTDKEKAMLNKKTWVRYLKKQR